MHLPVPSPTTLLIALVSLAPAVTAVAESPRPLIPSARETVEFLASPALNGRLTGTPDEQRAAEFLASNELPVPAELQAECFSEVRAASRYRSGLLVTSKRGCIPPPATPGWSGDRPAAPRMRWFSPGFELGSPEPRTTLPWASSSTGGDCRRSGAHAAVEATRRQSLQKRCSCHGSASLW